MFASSTNFDWHCRFRLVVAKIILICLAVSGCTKDAPDTDVNPPTNLAPIATEPTKEESAEDLAKAMELRDRDVWASERLAQQYEQPIVQLWDDLRRAKNPYEVLVDIPFTHLIVGEKKSTSQYPWGIHLTDFEPTTGGKWDVEHWRTFLQKFAQGTGMRLVQTEWHHSKFEPPAGDAPARSVVAVEAHLSHPTSGHRVILRGDLLIAWSQRSSADGQPTIGTIDARGLQIVEREATPPLANRLRVEPLPVATGQGVMVAPLIVQDLNADGLPEILLAGANTVLFNRGEFNFDREELFDPPVTIRNTGCVADFTGDGQLDFLGVDESGISVLFAGNENGRFHGIPRRPWQPEAIFPSAITAGDIDGDGDLDVWFTQYKPPYRDGQMPTPFYDAIDGHPSYLFVNDGTGTFTDHTAKAGLAGKRRRRTYSTSFVDLDYDADLDLLVVSDFSGLDLYENDGLGNFTDATGKWINQRHAFGMGHTFGDFNRDGEMDLYMVGMSSTTARRLDQLGLAREDFAHYANMRAPMTYGNRLYSGSAQGFKQSPVSDQVARSGWAWGCAAFDLDNDGDDELYVANGHISGESARDYCTQYWCHDVYAGTSKENQEVARLLTDTFRPTAMRGLDSGKISWNGYEHNKLYLNLEDAGFLEIAHLMNVAYEFDARGVLAPDLDLDGRRDLLVVRNDWIQGKVGTVAKQSLYCLRNELESDHYWVGISLESRTPNVSPIGAKVILTTGGKRRTHQVVTGDSFYAQQPATVHWGLGTVDNIESIEVIWPSGETTKIDVSVQGPATPGNLPKRHDPECS